jgi:hypothetical protein
VIEVQHAVERDPHPAARSVFSYYTAGNPVWFFSGFDGRSPSKPEKERWL